MVLILLCMSMHAIGKMLADKTDASYPEALKFCIRIMSLCSIYMKHSVILRITDQLLLKMIILKSSIIHENPTYFDCFTCVAKGESRSRSAVTPSVRLSVRPSQNLVIATRLKLLIQLS